MGRLRQIAAAGGRAAFGRQLRQQLEQAMDDPAALEAPPVIGGEWRAHGRLGQAGPRGGERPRRRRLGRRRSPEPIGLRHGERERQRPLAAIFGRRLLRLVDASSDALPTIASPELGALSKANSSPLPASPAAIS